MAEHKKFYIEIGEKLLTPTEQVQTYFFYVTPTGATVNIKDSLRVKQLSFNKGVDSTAIKVRLIKINYEILVGTLVLQMRCIHTALGRRRKSEAFNFEVGDADFPMIEITGFAGFGKFVGYAKIDDGLPDGVSIKMLKPSRIENEPQMGLIW